VARFPSKAHFASWNGTAPIDASSGDQVRHRLSRAGNRQINPVLHIMAVVQLRHGGAYYDRKVAAGKTPREAMRCLKRRLSDVVYHQMVLDARARSAGPGGHLAAATGSAAAGGEKTGGGYYMNAAQQNEPDGRWFGKGAEALGLRDDQVVTREPYMAAYNMIDPQTGERLPGRAAGS